MFNKFLLLILLYILPISVMADDAPSSKDWQAIDRIGLYEQGDDNHLKRNLWRNYTQEEAVEAVSLLPQKLTSPAYRNLAKKLLLSEGRKNNEDITRPLLLVSRLQKLIDYGLFDEALELYNKAIDGNETMAEQADLAMIKLQLSLLDADLPSVCLDVQASKNDYETNIKWQNLAQFCTLRFNKGQKINMNTVQLDDHLALKSLLVNDPISPQDIQSTLSALVAYNDRLIDDTSYNNDAKQAASLPDITVKLSLDDSFSKNETYVCYAIEAAKRGIINTEKLTSIYDSISFSDSVFETNNGQITLHPCHIPAYFHQRLNRDNQPNKDDVIKAMLDVSQSLPARAMAPFLGHVTDIAEWRADIILGANGITMPKNDSYSPLFSIQNLESLSISDYKTWLDTDNHRTLFEDNTIDPLAIPYISSILSSKNTNFLNNPINNQYAKLFSLTYGKKSLHLGLGLREYLQHAYQTDKHATVVTSLLSLIGDKSIKDLNPDALAVILTGLKAYKLDKDAVTLSFEYLQ